MPAHIDPGEPEIVAMIISEGPSHVVVAVELSKNLLARHRRLIESLAAIAARPQPAAEDR
jgi:hypothetical protein